MKRPAPFLRCALLLVLAVSLQPSRAQGQASEKPTLPHRPAQGAPQKVDPNKLTPANFKSPKLRGWINDVPDTGQFLPDTAVVLRVGPRVTTAGMFVREWYDSYPEYRPSPDSAGRAQFIKTLIHRDVLGMTALAQNRKQGFEDRLALRETRQRLLTAAVYQRVVADSVTVDESEIRKVWDSYNWAQRLRHIVVEDKNGAERVRRELVSGRITWAAAVKKYSISKTDVSPDGEIGWVTPEKLNDIMVVRVYGLKPGETSLPVQDVVGWHIVQSIERKPMKTPSYETLRKSIRGIIRSVKQAERSEKLMAMLRLQNGVVYDTTAATFAATRFFETTDIKTEGMGTTLTINGAAPEFDQPDTSRLIARWNNGGRFSIGDLVHAYTDVPPVMRPALTRMELVIAFVESIILEPSIAAYGASRGFEQDPLVKLPMDRKLEELMVEHMYQDSIGTRVWVSKDERKAFYQANLPKFFTYPSVDYAAMFRPSKEGADSVVAMLKAGKPMLDIIAADSLKGLKSGSLQHRRQDENGPYQKALFEEMRPGDVQVFGPDKQGDYIILNLLKFDGGRQLTYEESEALIDESLQNQKSEAALNAMIERLKPNYPVWVRWNDLMLIRLVDPTTE